MRTGYASHTPRIAFWVTLTTIIGIGYALCPYPSVGAAEVESPEGVVRQYYTALNRRDVEAARRQWKTPPSRLQDMVQQVEWYRVEDSTLLQEDASAAQVKVTVTGKRLNQQPEQWSGTVKLEKIAGAWKIVTMPLTQAPSAVKTPRPPDAPTPGLPAQPQATGASSMTKESRQPAVEPPNWSFKQIPFGQPRGKVIQQFVGATIDIKDRNLSDLSDLNPIANDFRGGFLDREFVTMHNVSYTDWTDLKSIGLYFARDKDRREDLYRTEDKLFVVIKVLRPEINRGSETFTGGKEAISRQVGKEPKTFSEPFRRPWQANPIGTTEIAKWDLDTMTVYYVHYNLINAGPPSIIAYIDKEGWKQHVGTVEAAEAARKQEQRNQAGTAIERNF